MASSIAAGLTSGTALNFSGDTSGALVLQTNGTTTAVTISTAQVVTLAQPLPVASGGSGVTTSTGTGANVLGTSPTLTTPTISSLSSASATALTLQSAGTTAITIDTSQNVGIGTSSPASRLSSNVSGVGSVTALNLTNDNSGFAAGTGPAINFGVSSSSAVGAFGKLEVLNQTATSGSNSYMAFSTRLGDVLAERMRIDCNGDLLVGVTADPSGSGNNGAAFYKTANNYELHSRSGVNTTSYVGIFYNGNGTVGNINTSGSATSYATSSDYRLKNTIAPMTGALAKVALLRPCTYKWNADGSDGQGFIAHELQEVVEGCVTGEKDATREEEYEVSPAVPAVLDSDGVETTPAVQAVKGTRTVPSYQGVDTSFLVATLTSAIQEQQAMIMQLQADVAALKR